MKDKHISQALSQAINALGSVARAELEELSLLESTFILAALPDAPSIRYTRRHIAERIRRELKTSWIKTGDLYEVFSAVAALWRYDPQYVTADQLAAAIKRMLKSEVEVGGPYRSNATMSASANAQIALLMRLVAKPLPKVEAYLNKIVDGRYFKNAKLTDIGLIYLLSKASTNPNLNLYVADSWQQPSWRSPGHTAIALGILETDIQTPETDRAFAMLLHTQQPNGFWKNESIIKGAQNTISSHLLITALVVETLTKYTRDAAESSALSLKRRHEVVAHTAKELFDTCAEPLHSTALTIIDYVCAADKNFEIALIPHFFASGLATPMSLTDQQDIMLSLANLYCWVAYTIYDDFLDNEGQPWQLPIANIALRACLDCYRITLSNQENFQHYIARTFAAMDEANAWEVNHCRFTVNGTKVTIPQLPKYGNRDMLATRAFAHALGPMAILAQGLANDNQTRHIESAFRHYLIARQLNDDMCDWQQDIQAGQASYVVTAILRDMNIKSGTHNLNLLLLGMQKRFRRTTVLKIIEHIRTHITLARQAFAESLLMRDTNDIYSLLDTLELSAARSLDKRSKGQVLLAQLTKPPLKQKK